MKLTLCSYCTIRTKKKIPFVKEIHMNTFFVTIFNRKTPQEILLSHKKKLQRQKPCISLYLTFITHSKMNEKKSKNEKKKN